MYRTLIVAVVVVGCLAFASTASALNINGSNGDDRLQGTPRFMPFFTGADVIKGYGGNDQIRPLTGHDWVDGGSGVDAIYAAKDSPTVVFCGPNTDVVLADWTDYLVDCEGIFYR